MQLYQFYDISEFSDRTQAYLLQHEAEHNLLLGITHTLLHYPKLYPNRPYLTSVEAEGDIIAVAIRTPPHKLVLSKVKDLAALTLIVEDLYSNHKKLPGVSGLVPEAQAFAQTWQTLVGQPYQLTMQMRIHQLTAVQPVVTTNGSFRPAIPADRCLLLRWFKAFVDEALESFPEDAEQSVDHALRKQSLYVWEDSVPVAFACGSRAMPSAGRIGPVYTPPEYRRQGYATACVAALSQRL